MIKHIFHFDDLRCGSTENTVIITDYPHAALFAIAIASRRPRESFMFETLGVSGLGKKNNLFLTFMHLIFF